MLCYPNFSVLHLRPVLSEGDWPRTNEQKPDGTVPVSEALREPLGYPAYRRKERCAAEGAWRGLFER